MHLHLQNKGNMFSYCIIIIISSLKLARFNGATFPISVLLRSKVALIYAHGKQSPRSVYAEEL